MIGFVPNWTDNIGNGYRGYSMSNNAVAAYENNERPLSKWTKRDILKILSEYSDVDFTKLSVKTLKEKFLKYTGYHHTSKYYNTTDFYSVDIDFAEMTTQEDVDVIQQKQTMTEKRKKTKKYIGTIKYLTWSGTRKYPKAKKNMIENVCIEERGCFYIVTDPNGKELLRKKIGSNGTEVIRNH